MLSQKYKGFLNKVPRRTNECWLGDMYKDKGIFVCGYKFLIHFEGTALRIWQLMDGSRTVMEMVKQLCEECTPISEIKVLEETVNFIIQLEKIGLAAWRSRPLFEEVQLND